MVAAMAAVVAGVGIVALTVLAHTHEMARPVSPPANLTVKATPPRVL
jgi:hypothetical protein